MKDNIGFLVLLVLLLCTSYFQKTEGKRNPIKVSQEIKEGLKDKYQAIKKHKKNFIKDLLHKPLYEFLPHWVQPGEEDIGSEVSVDANISEICLRLSDFEFRLPLKDPEDCHCFYHCAHGQIVGHECCPSNLAFNPITLTCDWVPNIE